jgi:hypothetical protein
MKVEIDADELCELRGRADAYDDDRKYWRGEAGKLQDEVYGLRQSLCRRAMEIAHLSCEKPSSNEFRELTAERDWWRNKALIQANIRDRQENMISEQFTLEQIEGFDGHRAALRDVARAQGYEVPE